MGPAAASAAQPHSRDTREHALEATDGKTYAQLDRDDPLRQTAMSASFLRASLFTSVVAFGVAAMAMVLGLMQVLTGWALVSLSRREVADERTPV